MTDRSVIYQIYFGIVNGGAIEIDASDSATELDLEQSIYLLDDYADEKREAWNKLGDRLEAILNSSNVVSLKSA
jgi:hypothetical protein